MKKYFFNEDGTIKIINMVVLITVILVIAIVFIITKLINDDVFSDYKPHTTKEVTSKVKMCDNCSMKFTSKKLVLNAYSEYSISDYIETKNIAINSVKFEVEDNSFLAIENKEQELVIVTKNKVGSTVLKASYDKIKISIEVEIIAEEIIGATLIDHPYYIYNGRANDLAIITDPIGIDIANLDLRVENTDIAEIIDGKLVGKSKGETRLILTFNEEVIEREIIVLDDLIHITLNNNSSKEEIYHVKLEDIKNNTINIIVTLDDNSNVGYTSDNLVISHDDNNTEVMVEYDGKNIGVDISYKYRITLGNIENASSTIKFSINDTTYRLLTIGE